MNLVWQHLTLAHLSPWQWREVSYVHRLLRPLRGWRQHSWLFQWADPLGFFLVAVVLGLAPFVSTALIGVLLLACASFWVMLTLTDQSGWGFTPIHLLVLLYWGVATAATALSPVKSAALSGWVKLSLYLILFALMARILRSPRLRNWLVTLYLLTTLIVSGYGLRQWFFGAEALATWVDPASPLAKTTRIYSYLGNPNLLAGYVIPAIAFGVVAMFVWQGWLPKVLALLISGVNSACLVLTFSRGGWLGFVALLAVLVILLFHWWSLYLPRFWQIWTIPILLAGSGVLLVIAVLKVAPLRDRVVSMFAGREDSSNNFRLNVWYAVIDMIRDRPILGIGPGNSAFNQIYPLYQRPNYSALSAYSVLLENAVEMGFIGLGCFLWLLLVTLNQGWLQLQRLRQLADPQGLWLVGAIAALAGMLVHGLVDTVWYRPQVNTLWWLAVALIASYYPVSRSETV
ncbi:MAG: putative bicarbonate transporter, IctB family [Cyanothece sp. SIO1E1]|nr:putative bicarbonate transporter, IctB family [Cyanothece sp. SIO1E1]